MQPGTRLLPALLACLLAGCASAPERPPLERVDGKAPIDAPQLTSAAARPDLVDPRTAVRNFVEAVERVRPVAETFCRQSALTESCDYRIVVDDAVNAAPNAFQTFDDQGNPVIAFTIPLIAEARNRDEIAFIMAHEAAHHILGHLIQQRRNAAIGAGTIGTLIGILNPDNIDQARALGAEIGARSYSKEFELEADALGTRIALAAGYDPVRGAEFFNRVPDPGNRFLGSHPANADRIETVRRVAAQAREGG